MFRTRLGCLLVVLVTALGARGASIAWSVGNIDGTGGLGDASVSTNGTLVEAANFGGEGVPNPSINTVTFTGINFVGGGAPVNLSGLTYNNSQTGNGVSGIGAIDALLETIAFQSGANFQTANLTGLVSGRDYEVQFFLSHLPTASRSQEIDDGAGNSIVMKNASPSQFVTGTFTADATTQFVGFDNLDPGSQLLSGYQLRDVTPVPEPSAIVVLALTGLMGMIRRKRRLWCPARQVR